MGKVSYGYGGSWSEVDECICQIRIPGPGDASNGPGGVHWDFPDFTGRVHKGMDLLDELAHGWPDEIDVTVLNLDDGSKCILGQAWPHYARLLGLAVTGTHLPDVFEPKGFDWMATHLHADGSYMERVAFAASIGCALGEEDFTVLNAMTKAYVIHKLGPAAHAAAGHIMMSQVSRDVVARAFEVLTETWLREIAKARAAGRWETLVVPSDVRETRELLTV